MKIALSCPASLPATQFGGIMFLCLDIAKESSKLGQSCLVFNTIIFYKSRNVFSNEKTKF